MESYDTSRLKSCRIIFLYTQPGAQNTISDLKTKKFLVDILVIIISNYIF